MAAHNPSMSAEELTTLVSELEAEAKLLKLSEEDTKKHVSDALREIRLANREAAKRLQFEKEQREKELAQQKELAEQKFAAELAQQKELEEKKQKEQKEIEEERLKIDKEKLVLEQAKLRLDERSVADAKESKEKSAKLKGLPKLPYFDDKHDDIESYLFRFEKHAVSLQWKRSEWPMYLVSLLKGKALTYYQELTQDDAVDYDKLREHLLRRFRCTEEGFRTQFRSVKPESGENMHTFFSRLSRFFYRWLELAKVKDFKQLCDLLLREQILSSCSTQLVTFLRESKFATADEMIAAAERYKDAHPSQVLAAKGSADPFTTNVGIVSGDHSNRGQNQRGQFSQRRGWDRRYDQSFRGGGSYRTDQSYRGGNSFQSGQRTFSRGGNNFRGSGFGRGDRGRAFEHRAPAQSAGRGLDRSSGTSTDRGVDSNCRCSCDKLAMTGPTSGSAAPTSSGEKLGMVAMSTTSELPSDIQTCRGTLNGCDVTVMLDSGCTTVGVKRSLVSDDQFTGSTLSCRLFDGSVIELPTAVVSLDCPAFSGQVTACVIENPVCEVILGRVPGSDVDFSSVSCAVQTRGQVARDSKPFRPLLTARAPKLDVTPEALRKLQREDDSLRGLFDKVSKPPEAGVSYVIRDNLLYRCYQTGKDRNMVWQLVVPTSLRDSVLIAAHDGIFGGHMGAGSTFKRIRPFFFWPAYNRAVTQYCRSCDACQRTCHKGRVPPAPFQRLPVIDVPFSRVAIDIIGPISPVSARGARWVLTVVDVATRYPEAVPLRSITTEAIAEALVEVFSRTGLPDEILSDNGSQFTSDVMRQVCRMLSISQLHSSVYHAEGNGLVERFNGSLKSMLRRLMFDKPSDWDRYIPAALFAYREIPQASTGFSPFELMFGRVVKGPSQLLYDTWTGAASRTDQQLVSDYVEKLGGALKEMVQKAQDAVQEVQSKSRRRQLSKAKVRSFKSGQKVLVLLPQASNKMLLRWGGPFSVIKRVNVHNYVVETSPGVQKLFHVNLLREYVVREQPVVSASVSVLVDECEDQSDLQHVRCLAVPSDQTETVEDVIFPPTVPLDARPGGQAVLQKHADMLTDLPGDVDLLDHHVRLTQDIVVNVRQYPMPFESEAVVRQEVEKMLRLGVIEPSVSPFASPIVLVRKKDGSTRFCIDFRALNKVTRFDAEPIPDVEVLFTKLKGKTIFSKLDLAKGYWQIPMAPEDKEKTAFRTPLGLFQFRRMPFGLCTAPSTFARMMNMLDFDRFKAVHFFDDILVASESWEEHWRSLDGVFSLLKSHGLTVRPSKVELGLDTIEFLGHRVGQGVMRPVVSKVSRMLNIAVPTTKKQVQAVLGLFGFYRRYVPDFAALVAPLTDLTGKQKPSKVVWSQECQTAFDTVRNILSAHPVLLLPDFRKPFTVRTDASNTGLGAVLLQANDQNELRPVLFASRKLLDRETRYSTVERECLAVVWAVDKFHRYIYGRHFYLQTDHSPLTYLSASRSTNNRLLRWALALQDYSFSVIPIPGRVNHDADVLSRLHP